VYWTQKFGRAFYLSNDLFNCTFCRGTERKCSSAKVWIWMALCLNESEKRERVKWPAWPCVSFVQWSWACNSFMLNFNRLMYFMFHTVPHLQALPVRGIHEYITPWSMMKNIISANPQGWPPHFTLILLSNRNWLVQYNI